MDIGVIYREGSLDATNLIPVVKENGKLNFSAIALPFKFPFMGTQYDTIYVSDNALITFSKNDYIYPYLHDGRTYLRNRRCISAGYSASGESFRGDFDTIYMSVSDSAALFQWKYKNPSNNFTQISSIRINNEGKIEIGRPIIDYGSSDLYWQGISAGDGIADHVFMLTLNSDASLDKIPTLRFRLFEGEDVLLERLLELPTTVSRPLILNVGNTTKSVDTLVKYSLLLDRTLASSRQI